jgi:hypothetical protein
MINLCKLSLAKIMVDIVHSTINPAGRQARKPHYVLVSKVKRQLSSLLLPLDNKTRGFDHR